MGKISSYMETRPFLMPVVVGFLLLPDDKVLLGLRKSVSLGLGKNLISGIGGKVGDQENLKGETCDDALIREFKEEIRINLLQFRKMAEITFLFPSKPKWNQSAVAYLINDWEGDPKETDSIKPQVFSQASLPIDQMWDDNQYWVPLILENKQVRGTFLYGKGNSNVIAHEVEIASFS
ncbi:NUDIX domain-containing protein [Candidatus Dojkabacteria bacterium]|nr:NUDIX domain-containing protein [Candidatus Dojkabacteria bacterium]